MSQKNWQLEQAGEEADPWTEESQAVYRQSLKFMMPGRKAKISQLHPSSLPGNSGVDLWEATAIPESCQAGHVELSFEQPNTIHQPQNEKHPFTMASEEIPKLPDASRTVVDQDMLDWFAELFDSASIKPHFTPSIASSEDVPQGIKPRQYSLQDIDHKSIYLQDKNLVAAPLQGDNSAHEEILSVLPNRFLDRQKIPLILGVKEGNHGISCGKEGEPKLQIEDTNLTHLYNNDEEAKRFTFFKAYNGSTHTFESASHPGWFLSSPVEAHKPLTLTSHPGEALITDFYFHYK